MIDRNTHPISPVALVGLVAVVSLGSLGDGAAGGVWCHTARGDERTQPHGALVAQWFKGLSQAVQHLHGHDSATVMAAKLCVYPQPVVSPDAARLPRVDAADVPPPRSHVLPALTNLPPPSA